MMIKSTFSISVIFASILLTINTPSANANDCTLSINTKESISCLQRKIDRLEQKLEQNKTVKLVLPKGAVIDFKGKSCPNGWVVYEQEQNGIVNFKANDGLVKCQKL